MAAVSDIDAAMVAEYLNIDESDDLISPILTAAKAYAVNYTGHTEEELDEYEDVTIAVLVLCSDFYDQRTQHTDKPINDPTVTTILSMHRCNLLPTVEDDEEDEE